MDAAYKLVGSANNILYDIIRKVLGTTSPKVDQELVRQAKQTAELAVSELRNMVRTAHPIVRLAGISGALAVALGAYGAHAFYSKEQVPNEFKQVYDTANKYHFLHTIALLAVPLCRKPMLTGALLLLGTSIFSGSCYYYALTQERWVRKITPYGGTMLIVGWLSMAL